ncbi:transcriptional regulator [Bacterioplanes sanyensis]|uniref:LysR family transcriptional regulator n=1 Tax=Bacterioplanes sanyensis TaxID=1249553 RepID=UPI00167C3F32|nr:LysR family transcriptional regulator [Bacterioplanes sanyensis]GGY42481.1 transcriptional regulator [Bacterioplanes sanyensis]
MDTQALRAFVAVAEQHSFSLAAEALHLTQSAVSKRVQQLEQQLDCTLFDRHNRTISLTESGHTLLPKAQNILALMEDTRIAVANLSTGVSGRLALATSHHIGLHRLPPFLRELSHQYPQVDTQLAFMGSEHAYQAVQQRQVELALTTLAQTPPTGISQQPIWQDPLLCVCSPQHPLAKQSITGLKQLSQHPAILPEPNTTTFELVAQVFRQQGLTVQAPMPTNYLETIKMMVSVGLGWSLLPATMVDEQLHVLPWPAQPLERQLGLVYLQQRTLSNAARAFVTLLTNAN